MMGAVTPTVLREAADLIDARGTRFACIAVAIVLSGHSFGNAPPDVWESATQQAASVLHPWLKADGIRTDGSWDDSGGTHADRSAWLRKEADRLEAVLRKPEPALADVDWTLQTR